MNSDWHDNAQSKAAHERMTPMQVMTKGKPDDWVASCGLCNAAFAIRSEDAPEGNPGPHGTFCPDCQKRRHIAPGVLHWSRRGKPT